MALQKEENTLFLSSVSYMTEVSHKENSLSRTEALRYAPLTMAPAAVLQHTLQ